MAEWSNAPDSKSGVQVYLYRGFESLSFRQLLNVNEPFGAFLFSTHMRLASFVNPINGFLI